MARERPFRGRDRLKFVQPKDKEGDKAYQDVRDQGSWLWTVALPDVFSLNKDRNWEVVESYKNWLEFNKFSRETNGLRWQDEALLIWLWPGLPLLAEAVVALVKVPVIGLINMRRKKRA